MSLKKQKKIKKDTFPGFSNFENSTICCCIPSVYFPSNDKHFLGHWEYDPEIPIFVILLIVSSYLISICFSIDSFLVFIAFTFCFLLFLISYLKTIIEGPGYFPFYWPNYFYAPDSTYSGIASTPEQIKYAQSIKRTGRVIFSKKGGRVVLRPDHFCGWTSSWIGKRNHKFFILFTFYGTIYILYFLVLSVYQVTIEFSYDSPTVPGIILIIYLIIGVLFFFFIISFLCTNIFGLVSNTTNWESWNNVPSTRFYQGCLLNVEDVCGSSSQWFCWLFPVSPWKNIPIQLLYQEFPSYKDTDETITV